MEERKEGWSYVFNHPHSAAPHLYIVPSLSFSLSLSFFPLFYTPATTMPVGKLFSVALFQKRCSATEFREDFFPAKPVARWHGGGGDALMSHYTPTCHN